MKHLKYLLMLALVAMPLTACDEDDDDEVVDVPVVGTVAGTVSAEGSGLAGVSVTLSGAQTLSATTDASGAYSFTNVEAGSYGVSIDASNHSDVTFPQTAKSTAITTQGQTATVDFSGSYIRTASITGTVIAGSQAVAGVTVTVTGGPDSVTKTDDTDLGGDFSISGLRGGDYTITLSDVPANFNFAQMAKDITVETGGQGSATFVGTELEEAVIMGSVLAGGSGVGGVTVTLSGGASATETTNANGEFTFDELDPGSYTVTISGWDEEKYEFDVTELSADVDYGDVEELVFSGNIISLAKISINAITTGGGPINLGNVFGQIEVALNIQRGEKPLDKVEVLLDDVIVATQTFSSAAEGAPEMQETEVVTLNVPTNQVRQGENGKIPAVWNGQRILTAILYEVNGDQPLPTNEVPMVLNNQDVVLPADFTFAHEEGVDCATGIGPNFEGETYCTGGTVLGWYEYVSFGTIQPEDVYPDDFDGTTNPYEITTVIEGSPETGQTVMNTMTYPDREGSTYPDFYNGFEVDFPDGAQGPDGSVLQAPYGFSRLGAEFTLSGQTRWFVITPDFDGAMPNAPEGPQMAPGFWVPDVDALYVDNLGPTVEVDGETGSAYASEQVAFNDDFDEAWINQDYIFAGDIHAQDYGVGLDVDETFTQLYDSEAAECAGDDVITGADLPAQTIASDGTPDGYQLCGRGADLLGNGDNSGPSNYFGYDNTQPLIRIHGTEAAVTPAIAGTDPTAAGDSAVFNIAASYAGTETWGLEAVDTRSGLEQTGVAGYPAMQTLSRTDVTGVTFCADVDDMENEMGTLLSDGWVRTSTEEAFTCDVALDAGTQQGYFRYEGYVVDRAGNESEHVEYFFMVDDDAAAEIGSMNFATPFYTPGEDADFTFFGSDDLEVIAGTFAIRYPTIIGDVDLVQQKTLGERWDGIDPNFDADAFTTALSGITVTFEGILGRLDFTCDGTGAPYSSCPGTDEGDMPTDSADFNTDVGVDATALLPTDVLATDIIDAGSNPYGGAGDQVTFLPAQWTSTIAQQWVPSDIITWQIKEPTADTFVGEHLTTTSVIEEYFDAVLLILNNGGELTNCGAVSEDDGLPRDNGLERYWEYEIDEPTEGLCADVKTANPAATYHMVGVKNGAALVTNPGVS